MISAGVAGHFGLTANFLVFACLNVGGALLAWFTVRATPPMPVAIMMNGAAWARHFKDPRLVAGFGIGFSTLFAFIGTFSFVNFVLMREPLSLGMMQVGFAYLVFLPAIVTTSLAGTAARRFGVRPTIWSGLGLALAGLPLLIVPALQAVLLGMVLVSAGTFIAQAAVTGYVNRTAETDRGAASGIYLACYFTGGLMGSAILGQLFDRAGWPACVLGIGFALVTACVLASRLRMRTVPSSSVSAT